MPWSLLKFLGRRQVASNESLEVAGSSPTPLGYLPSNLENRYLCRNPEVIAQRAKNETILFCMSSGQYYSLNEVGTRIWEMFDGAHTAVAIIEQLEGEYDAPHLTLAEDVLLLARELSDNGLLVEAAASSEVQSVPTSAISR